MTETHARASDPDTSHAAVPVDITDQCLRVLWAYLDGAALLDHDAYRLIGLDDDGKRFAHQRCSDLRHGGFIERVGKATTPSGKWGYTCRITLKGLKYLCRQIMEPSYD